jgi:hypothetical protein
MAQFKLNEADTDFLKPPGEAAVMAAGTSGTETWIERERDCVVRIGVSSAARATEDRGTLEVCIEVGGATAKSQDGPLALEGALHASQSVQVLVKAGERLAFKAFPLATGAQVLRTVVWAVDMKPAPAAPARPD